MVLLPSLYVNPDRIGIKLRAFLCLPVPAPQTGDVLQYVSTQPIVFFAPLRVLSPQSLRFGSPVSSHHFGCSVPNRFASGPRFP